MKHMEQKQQITRKGRDRRLSPFALAVVRILLLTLVLCGSFAAHAEEAAVLPGGDTAVPVLTESEGSNVDPDALPGEEDPPAEEQGSEELPDEAPYDLHLPPLRVLRAVR